MILALNPMLMEFVSPKQIPTVVQVKLYVTKLQETRSAIVQVPFLVRVVQPALVKIAERATLSRVVVVSRLFGFLMSVAC